MYRYVKVLCYSLFCLLSPAYAITIDAEHPIRTEIITNPSSKMGFGGKQITHKKTIMLMNVHMTPREEEIYLSYKPTQRPQRYRWDNKTTLPSQWDNGSNGVPVLNQGYHGTCVTFAVTGALDAMIGRGDYISQFCNLQLGNHLAKNSFRDSGWSSVDAETILRQITDNGFIAKDKESQGICNEITEYPAEKMEGLDKELTLAQFHSTAERIRFGDRSGMSYFYWKPLLSESARFDTEYQFIADDLVENTKKALLHHGRQGAAVGIIFAVGFPDYCHNAFCGKHSDSLDSWVLTKQMIVDREQRAPRARQHGAHEMIITGYDDNATAVDQEGDVHKGLFKIRNSWGTNFGDNGEFYMSYDYFKAYIIDVHKLVLQELIEQP